MFLDPPHRIHVSNTRFTLVMNEAKAHIALHVSEFCILLCIWFYVVNVSVLSSHRMLNGKVKFIPFQYI